MSWLSKLLWSGEQRPPTSWAEWTTEARSRSGYAREAAVQALALSGHGDALPVLLERVNDWVPGVHKLVRRRNGTRSVSVAVPQGQEIQFRYLAEGGHWFDDEDADAITPEGSLVRV